MPMLHQVTAGAVRHDGVRNAMVTKLVGGQRRALVTRPGFANPHVNRCPLSWAM